MDDLKLRIEELNSMQQTPDIYLYNYFYDLKRQVDLEYSPDSNELGEYLTTNLKIIKS